MAVNGLHQEVAMPSTTRRAIAIATACCALSATMAASAPGDSQERPACPPAYDLGARTFRQALPLYQAQLDAGLLTKAELKAGFENLDVNGNEILCFKTFGHDPVHPYLIIDDPGGNPR
jgi:hypothetical protein